MQFWSCTLPAYDASTSVANPLQKASAINAVNIALSKRDCAGALSVIYPLYNSANSDNGIRMATASSYGCLAKVNVFSMLTDFLAFPGSFAGSGLWEFMAQEFPSVANPDDKVVQSAANGTDAVMASLAPGTVLVSTYTVNSTTNNPGSLLTADRIDDANAYLSFISMALMGSLENRYGSPLPNHHKSTPLPWITPALVPGDGCSFASALLNFYDGIQYVIANSPSSVANTYSAINTFLTTSLDAACTVGCISNGCAMACTTCPRTLRSRANCTGLTTDVNSCAAAGLVAFVNGSWTGPP